MPHTLSAIDVFDKNANLYQDKFMNVDLYKESLDFFVDNLNSKSASILELGCGPGNITRYLLNQNPDLKITGTDLSVNMLELAKKNNPSAKFQMLDCRDLHKIKDKYDALVFGFCLPYVTKEEAIIMIHDGAKILNPGGLLYISTMEDDYTKSELQTGSTGDAVFIHYHQEDYLRETLLKEGFQIAHLSRKKYVDGNGRDVVDLILIAGR